MSSISKRADYRLEMLLGLGRSAQVYLAVSPEGERVALKLVRKEVLNEPRMRERFAQEVMLSLGLDHPHLVCGYGGQPYGEEAFLALEYFPEGTLEARLHQGSLPKDQALHYVSQITAAVAYLHQRGIVHQDIKPSNIYLKEGYTKLGDLGVARSRDKPSPLERAGSPYYMAPELYRGEQASTASDAYSLGILAFELLAGRRPFNADSYEGLLTDHLTSLPPRIREISPRLEQAVRGLLVKEPQERLSLKDFQQFLADLDTPEQPLPPRAEPTRKTSLLHRLLGRGPKN